MPSTELAVSFTIATLLAMAPKPGQPAADK